MKTIKLLLGISACFFMCRFAGYCETIYTKDGREIKAVIAEETEDDQEMVWYEIGSGDMVELQGIERSEVTKILNDDGTTSEYSPTYCKDCQKK